MSKGIPIRPNRKSLVARFLTTELICWNLPVSTFEVDTYNTKPFPRIHTRPITRHKASENQNAISDVRSFTPSIVVMFVILDIFGNIDIKGECMWIHEMYSIVDF